MRWWSFWWSRTLSRCSSFCAIISCDPCDNSMRKNSYYFPCFEETKGQKWSQLVQEDRVFQLRSAWLEPTFVTTTHSCHLVHVPHFTNEENGAQRDDSVQYYCVHWRQSKQTLLPPPPLRGGRASDSSSLTWSGIWPTWDISGHLPFRDNAAWGWGVQCGGETN